ncbi:membrane protein insertion efficiency factor YidD [Janthinobacterium sp. B9-8]|uniref:membrane protein insertion efficiency factor YidD n=1 Tax=Janthinobacterium sp. B9-8 TaxID=1236179 RepID=UPI0018D215DC
MRFILLLFIQIYKKYISPYKGFCCAYHVHTGRASCSTLGFRAVRRYGVFAGLAVLRQRMARCGQVYRQHTPLQRRPPIAQRGDCDLPGNSSFSDAGDWLSCCCNNCDWPRRKQQSANAPKKQSRWRRQ